MICTGILGISRLWPFNSKSSGIIRKTLSRSSSRVSASVARPSMSSVSATQTLASSSQVALTIIEVRFIWSPRTSRSVQKNCSRESCKPPAWQNQVNLPLIRVPCQTLDNANHPVSFCWPTLSLSSAWVQPPPTPPLPRPAKPPPVAALAPNSRAASARDTPSETVPAFAVRGRRGSRNPRRCRVRRWR